MSRPGLRAVSKTERERPPRHQRLLAPLRRLWHRLVELSGGRLELEWVVLGLVSLGVALALVPGPWGWAALGWVLGAAVVAGGLLRVFHRAWYGRLPRGARGSTPRRDLAFLGLTLFLVLGLARGHHLFAAALAREAGWAGMRGLAFGAPLAVGPMLAGLFLGPQVGMLLAVVGGLLAAWLWADGLGLAVYFVLTGVVAAHLVERGGTRLALIRAGMASSLAGVAVVSGLALMQGWLFSGDLLLALVGVGLSGLLAGVLAAGLAPAAEILFGYTTGSRLMELASLDHPALQELMLRAPGTYHHSLIVSSLVEAAAKQIGADHLLARVAALYHDIGKVGKPAYFVENQMGGPNRHQKLAPSMSALILISHVKEGVELARRHRLGRAITDIMAQHHGTRLIHFFYNKACEDRRRAGRSEPDPEAFRYPGPRPQSREAALVMLADTVEAACRSLDNPTPARIQGLVQSQINRIFAEGQLDECELTLKDLHEIAKSFNTILTGIFHQRVEYPQGGDTVGRHGGDTDPGPQRSGAAAPAGAETASAARLGRLGMRR